MVNLREPGWAVKLLAVVLAPAGLWLAGLWVYSLRPLPPMPAATGHRILWAANEWAQIPADGERCILANNVWNKGRADVNFEQEVFVEELNGKPALGWRWRSPWQMRPAIIAYPELICGNKPWDQPIGSYIGLPFHPGQKQLSADYKIHLQATGSYNMAFELWAVSQLPPDPASIHAEVMIWLANSGQRPSGIYRGSLSTGGVSYDLYINEHQHDASGTAKNEWIYVAYVARTAQLSGPLNFSPFLDDLRQRQILNSNQWITNVELGNEVADGAGIAEVQDFALHIGNTGAASSAAATADAPLSGAE